MSALENYLFVTSSDVILMSLISVLLIAVSNDETVRHFDVIFFVKL